MTEPLTAEEQMRRALGCLYIAVEETVAKDAGEKVHAYDAGEKVHAYCNELLEEIADRGLRLDALESELLRLAGPVCPHDGKRAVEHHFRVPFEQPTLLARFVCDNCCRGDHSQHLGVRCDGRYGGGQCDSKGYSRGCDCIEPHPPASEIEQWLRERSGR